jgi:protein SCO1
MKRALITLAALLVVAYTILRLSWHPPAPGGDFTLQSADGPVSLRDFRGQVVLLYFGYLSCPDICPTSLSVAGKGMKLLQPGEVERTRLLFVSVDPERDKAENVKRYASFFHPRFLGLVGKPEVIADVAKQYGAWYQQTKVDSAMGYTVDHTASIFVIAPNGVLVSTVPHGGTPEDVARAVRAAMSK